MAMGADHRRSLLGTRTRSSKRFEPAVKAGFHQHPHHMATEKRIQVNPRTLSENMKAFAQGFRPPTYTATEVLDQLKDPIEMILEKKGSADDILRFLQQHGIPINLAQVEKFIADLKKAEPAQAGKAPTRKARGPAAVTAKPPAPPSLPVGPPPVPPLLPATPPVAPAGAK